MSPRVGGWARLGTRTPHLQGSLSAGICFGPTSPFAALHALESTEERGHSANRQTAPVSIELSQQQERQRSGSLASTSGSSQVSSQPQSRTDDSFRQSNSNTPSPTTAPSWVAAVRGLISSKHDAMIFNLALPSLLALAADPLLAVTGAG